jgi:GGDEF domain-containing protein
VRGDPNSGGSASERLWRAARAARELSDALWDTLQQELSSSCTERARVLAQRLGEVTSTVALLLDGDLVASSSSPARERSGDERAVDERAVDERAVGGEERAAGGWSVDGQTLASAPVGPAEGAPFERRTPPDPIPPPSIDFGPGLASEHGRTRLVDEQEPATVTPFAPVEREDPEQAEIAIRDVRREEGSAAWISSVGRMLGRHSQDHLPFAVLLIEIVDVARLERSETPHDLHGIVAQVEHALGRGMRVSDELSRETLGRYWLLTPETNGTGARMLAERLAQLVRGSATHRGVPMEVAIGIAVCPEDGVDAPALAARADLGVYTARATGRSIAHTEPPRR